MGRVLILGGGGMLGGELQRAFGSVAIGWDREDADVTKFQDLRLKIKDVNPKPEAIINCVAFNDVDGAEEKKDIAYKLNAEVPGELAKICTELSIPLIHFSTNYVFDGQAGEYKESDTPNPQSVYAQSKYQGELEVQKNTDTFYIIRTAVLFGPKGKSELSKKSFVDMMLDLSSKTDTIKAVADETNSVTYVYDLADSAKKLLDQNQPNGIYHITNSGQASWYELAKEVFTTIHRPINLIAVPSTEFPRKAARPKKSVLINTKLLPLRTWHEALHQFLRAEADPALRKNL